MAGRGELAGNRLSGDRKLKTEKKDWSPHISIRLCTNCVLRACCVIWALRVLCKGGIAQVISKNSVCYKDLLERYPKVVTPD